VYALCTHKRERFKVSTGVSIPDKYWDNKNIIVKRSYPEYDSVSILINLTFQNLIRTATSIHSHNIEISIRQLRFEYYKRESAPTKRADSLLIEYSRWLDVKSPHLSYATIRNMMNTSTILREFVNNQKNGSKLYGFDKTQYEYFLNFLAIQKGLQDSTIDKHIKILKRFLCWAYQEEDFTFMNFKWKNIEDPIYLSDAEILKLLNADNLGHLTKSRDLFIFCTTTGMRYSDSQRFLPAWIKDEIIEYRMQKTGGKAYVPLFRQTKLILKKYSY